jgi:hypothetical protein
VIETLTGPSEGVIGFRMSGKLEASDYTSVASGETEAAG